VKGGTEPPRLLIYAEQGLGKTSLAAEFPRPVFILTETGIPKGLDVDVMGGRQLVSYGEIKEAMISLLTEKHDYLTVVFDSAGPLERLIQAEVCARNSWKSIEQPGYGKGYKECDYLWAEFMDGVKRLRETGMAVLILAHSELERVDEPGSQSFNRRGLSLHKRAAAIMEREVDAILLIKQDVVITKDTQGFGSEKNARAIAQSGELRWIYSQPAAAYVAKNRYDIPARVPYPRGQGFAQLKPYLIAAREDAPSPQIENHLQPREDQAQENADAN